MRKIILKQEKYPGSADKLAQMKPGKQELRIPTFDRLKIDQITKLALVASFVIFCDPRYRKLEPDYAGFFIHLFLIYLLFCGKIDIIKIDFAMCYAI